MVEQKVYPRVLTIAGSDSGGCAGIQADLRVFHALQCHGSSVITAVTAQNTLGVSGIYPLSGAAVDQQARAVLEDIGTDAIKIGMLFNQEIIHAVIKLIDDYPGIPVVVDPVCVATTGSALLQREAMAVLREQLLPRATLVTPNWSEACLLFGDNQTHWPKVFKRLAIQNCLLTGGDDEKAIVIDRLYPADGQSQKIFKHARIHTQNTHGSGCSLSSAIAALLAKKMTLLQAVTTSIDCIAQGIAAGADYQLGQGAGPLCFFYRIC
jgi:hydroxymethylpyrimidine/phosphomethylpyrimidine kinase